MATATAVKPSLTIKRKYQASPARVFKAWTDPKELAKWMGPLGTTAVEAQADVRVGGRFHIRMTVPGDEHNVSGVYREVVPSEKLVFTWAWHSTPDRELLVTVALKPDGNGTLMTFTHEQFFDEKARDDHEKGWLGTFTKLGTYLGLTPSKEDSMPDMQAGPPHGKFIWNELNTQNLDAAKAFLSTALGWSFESMEIPNGTYWMIKNGNDPVGGIFDMSANAQCKGVPEHWLSYVAVDDVDTRYKNALAKGAKEGRPPFDIPGVGRIAILQQPGGAMVGWITPKPM